MIDVNRYDPRLRYMLDEAMNPIPTYDLTEYFQWKNSLPKDVQTGIGMQLAKTTVGDVTVSTVFLGSDHRYTEEAPVLWETMIFGGPHDEDCIRYATHADALVGHEAACKKYLTVIHTPPALYKNESEREFIQAKTAKYLEEWEEIASKKGCKK